MVVNWNWFAPLYLLLVKFLIIGKIFRKLGVSAHCNHSNSTISAVTNTMLEFCAVLSTILDDYSRYIIAWKLCTTMKAADVTDTLEMALAASGCDQAVVRHKPRLLSDNGSCYISCELAQWLSDKQMVHVRGAPFHPQTQGKIERWHQTMKNRVLLENYYLPGDLEQQVGAFVDYYNNKRYHESLNNVTPADVYYGRDKAIIRERKKIKRNTINQRRLQHFRKAA